MKKKVKNKPDRRLTERISLRVRLALFFLITPVMLFAQQKTVSLQIKEMKIEQAIQQLRKTTDYKFLFNHEEVKNAGAKTLDLKNVPLESVMKSLLQGTNLTYRIEKNVVVIVPVKKQNTGKSQRVKISGNVVDQNQQPIPGVAVINSATKEGVTTDIDGNFTLDIPDDPGSILLFSMLGMKRQEVVVGQQRNLKISMEEDIVQLGDVIVTGYQTLSKERSAGSFTVVSGNSVSEKAGLTGDIMESMEGLTTGLSISHSDGQDKYLIRGTTSINSNRSPLFVVDGVSMTSTSFENLVNSNDIENITFLKDATAASIWGAQAANGVVVVTTKQGKNTDKKIKISYTGSYTYRGLPDYDYMQYMSSEQFIKSAREIFDPEYYTWNSVTTTNNGIAGNIPIVYPHEEILYKYANGESTLEERDAALAQMASRNNREQIEKNFMTPAYFTTHSLSFSGGSERHRYYGSLGYEHNTASDRKTDNKYQLNLKQDFKFTNWLKMDLGINMAMLDTKNQVAPYKTDLNTIFPYQMFADENGNPLSHAGLYFYEPNRLKYEQQSQKSLDYVPLNDSKNSFQNSNNFSARINAGLNIRLIDGLSYDGRFQYQRSNGKSELFYDQNSIRVREELVQFTTLKDNSPVYYLPTSGGYYSTSNSLNVSWTVRNQLMFDRSFEKSESQLTALAGVEIRSDRTNTQGRSLRGYNPQAMTYISYDEKALSTTGVSNPILPSSSSGKATLSGRVGSNSETEMRFVSLYANGAYTWKAKYSLNASIRVDQSNLFGSDPSVQFKPIWAAGAAWTMNQESFMKDLENLDRLNLRFSYGLGGNSPDPGLGGPYDVMYPVSNNLYADLGQSYVIITPANDKLSWEKTRIINGGVDFAVLSHRLSGAVDIYFKKTTDLLGEIPLHPASGWVKSLANLGIMKNSGVEISLNSHNIKSKNFNWRTDFTLTYNKNKITELYTADGLSATSIIHQNFVEGYAAQSLFAYRWAGLDKSGDPQIYNLNGEKIKLAKDLQDQDLDAVDCAGSMQPSWYGGLTNAFSYKEFELSFMFIYNLGHKMRDDRNKFYGGRLTSNIHRDFDNRWRKEGDEQFTNVPSYISNNKESVNRREMDFYHYADANILSASYIKLRDLTLSWSLPKNICNRLATDNIKIRLQAANLFYWAANKEGIDPESFNLKYGNRTTHYGPSYSVGLTVNFK